MVLKKKIQKDIYHKGNSPFPSLPCLPNPLPEVNYCHKYLSELT